jgi:hypothetical protein
VRIASRRCREHLHVAPVFGSIHGVAPARRRDAARCRPGEGPHLAGFPSVDERTDPAAMRL